MYSLITVAATHIHTHLHLFTLSKRGLSLTIYPAANQASSSRDDTKITRYSWYMSHGWVELANFETLLRIQKLVVSGRNRGKSSLANCQLHKDPFASPFISCSWLGQTTEHQQYLPCGHKGGPFPDANKMYNLPEKENTANIGNAGNVQQTAH